MWIHEAQNGVIILCQIQPKASQIEIIGLHGDPARLKIRVAAPPVEGEANQELIEFLSKQLKVPKSKIQITKGLSSRLKDVFVSIDSIDNIDNVEQVRARLLSGGKERLKD